MSELLKIDNLRVSFRDSYDGMTAVKGISLSVSPGETLALVGESGCGKTVTCKSIMGFLCSRGVIDSGQIMYSADRMPGSPLVDLASMPEKIKAGYRGSEIAMVPQDPMTSLDPMLSVGKQIAESIRLSERRKKPAAGLINGRVSSGGTRRMDKDEIVQGASAAAPEGSASGASEGSAGKPSVRQQALEWMKRVGIQDAEERYDDRPYQFSGGMRQRIVIAIALAGNPELLLADEPTTALDEETQEDVLRLLKNLQKETGVGIIFITHDLSLVELMADRVAIMKDGLIVEEGTVSDVFEEPNHEYTRQLLGYLDYKKHRGHDHRKDAGSEVVLSIKDLTKSYGNRTVLEDFSLEVTEGEIVGIVGRSGCGKTTLANCIMGIEKHDSGTIAVAGGRKVQMIFQDSQEAFNERMSILDIIAEPFIIGKKGKKAAARKRALELMDEVGLDPALADRRPYQLSGGQRQRAAIARALISEPDIIIADEPLTGLDVTAQAHVVHLFRKLVDDHGLTLMIIAHDRPMLEHISTRIVEVGRQQSE